MVSAKIRQTLPWVLALACLISILHAEPIKKLSPKGYVNDFAGVIDPSSAEAIRNIAGA